MTGRPDDRQDQSGRPNEIERPVHGDWIEAEIVASPVSTRSLGGPVAPSQISPAMVSPATASHVGPHGYTAPSDPAVPLAAPEPGSLASFFLDGERRLRTVWRFLLFFLAIVVVELGAAIATLIALAIWFGVANLLSSPETDAQAFSNWLNKSPLLMVGIGGMVSAPLSLGVCWVFRRFVDRRSLAQSGFVWPKSFVWGGSVGTLIGVVLISFSAVVVHLMGGLEWQGFGGLIMPLVLIVPLIGAAFHEEVLVRGYLLQNLVEIRRPWFGVFFTSLVFWLVHGLNPNAWSSPWVGVNLFLAGILLALAYLRSGNMLYPTAMHFGWNYAQGPLLGIPVSGMEIDGLTNLHPAPDAPSWLTGGQFGLEASAVTAVVQVIAIAALARSRTALPSSHDSPSRDRNE